MLHNALAGQDNVRPQRAGRAYRRRKGQACVCCGDGPFPAYYLSPRRVCFDCVCWMLLAPGREARTARVFWARSGRVG